MRGGSDELRGVITGLLKYSNNLTAVSNVINIATRFDRRRPRGC